MWVYYKLVVKYFIRYLVGHASLESEKNMEIFYRNFDSLFDFDRFKKLLQIEISLNLALCQSLYGFNPLTINPDREPKF